MSPRRRARRGPRPQPGQLTPAQRQATQARFACWLNEQLAATGWAVLGVMDAVPFSYTIGMVTTLGAPELIAIGLPADIATRLFNDIGRQIRTGRRFEPGESYDGILAGDYRVRFDPVHPSRYADYVMQAINYHGQALFPPSQLHWQRYRRHRRRMSAKVPPPSGAEPASDQALELMPLAARQQQGVEPLPPGLEGRVSALLGLLALVLG